MCRRSDAGARAQAPQQFMVGHRAPFLTVVRAPEVDIDCNDAFGPEPGVDRQHALVKVESGPLIKRQA